MGWVKGGYQPFSPHGLEGFAMVGTGGVRPDGLPPRGDWCGGNLRAGISMEPPRTSPHWENGWAVERRWAVEPDASSECGGRWSAEGRALPGGKKRQGWGESVGGERGEHPLFPPMWLVEGGGGRPLLRWRGRPVGWSSRGTSVLVRVRGRVREAND
jgi:hypothetical protein